MNKEPTQSYFPAEDFISENGVRGVFGRRRTPPRISTEPVSATAANLATAGEDTSAPAGGLGPLRRWSVAELIARAVAAPRPTA